MIVWHHINSRKSQVISLQFPFIEMIELQIEVKSQWSILLTHFSFNIAHKPIQGSFSRLVQRILGPLPDGPKALSRLTISRAKQQKYSLLLVLRHRFQKAKIFQHVAFHESKKKIQITLQYLFFGLMMSSLFQSTIFEFLRS